jgi:WD40 repeat protein
LGQYSCSVVFSPDCSQVASCSSDKTVRLWNAQTGHSIATLEGHTDIVRSVVFSPDGLQIASCSYDNTVRLWGARTGHSVATLKGHTDIVRSVVFSPDGLQIASCSSDNTVRLWDARTGHSISTLDVFTGDLRSISFSPDGHILWAESSSSHLLSSWAISGKIQYGASRHTLIMYGVIHHWRGNTVYYPHTLSTRQTAGTIRQVLFGQ